MLGRWSLIEADFQEVYGVDLTAVRGQRSWRWFVVRLAGLLSTESRIQRVFNPQDKKKKSEPKGGR
jgi:hypothetical protein